MFAKVFEQILDSSLAEEYQTRHIFMDLLVLANRFGEVDMTAEAIARRTNVPLQIIQDAICKLCKPDVNSRSTAHAGRRLIPLAAGRKWGWKIVNFMAYHNLRDEEARRDYMRIYMQKRRAKKGPPVNTPLATCKPPLAHVDVDVDVDTDTDKKQQKQPRAQNGAQRTPLDAKRTHKPNPTQPHPSPPLPTSLDTDAFKDAWARWLIYRKERRRSLTPSTATKQLTMLAKHGPTTAVAMIDQSITNGWQGLFEVKGNAHDRAKRASIEPPYAGADIPLPEFGPGAGKSLEVDAT